MRADDHLQVVIFAELPYPIRPEGDQTRPPRVGSQTLHPVALRRIRPQHVHEHDTAGLDRERALELLQLGDVRDAPPDAAVHARHAVLDHRREGKPLEQGVEPGPSLHALLLAQPLDALYAEPEQRVDVGLLVVTTEQVDVVGVLNLERQEQRHRLERIRPAVDVISQKEVIDVRDVARGARGPVLGEQAHEIAVLPVEVAEYLSGRA